MPSPTATLEGEFDLIVRSGGTAPFITFVNIDSSERAELSARSLGNWVAKTHFLLGDELGLGPGDRAAIDLPPHWMGMPVLLGCWFAGLHVLTSPAQSAQVAFVGPEDNRPADADDVYAVSLHPLGMPLPAERLHGADDYVSAVRPQPDKWPTVRAQGGPNDAALDELDRAAALATSRADADIRGIGAGARVLAVTTPTNRTGWLTAVRLTLAVGGSLVLAVCADATAVASRLDALAQSERATVRLSL